MSRIDDINYVNDPRVRALEKPTLTIEIDEIEYALPTRWVLCPTCGGNGTHVNPSIDCNGLTSEDFAEDPDFLEEYTNGHYDVNCYGCGGLRVIKEVDEERCDQTLLSKYYEQQREITAFKAEQNAERRMGA